MSKTKQENDMADHIGLVYVEIETQLSIPMWLGAIYDENQTGKRLDRSYSAVYVFMILNYCD